MSTVKEAVRAEVDARADSLVELSHRIHSNPELGFEEEQASQWLCEVADEAGFAVERGLCDLPTSFRACYGSGPLHIAFVAEYDSLPGIGHACGHNLIAAISTGAALAAARVADDAGLTVTLMGTPAQENGGGKITLLDGGAFEGVHAAMMTHPAPIDVADPVTLAMSHFTVRYHGRESHASMFPELGINAADALTVAQCAIGVMRQQIRHTERIHGVCRHGGEAPHVTPHEVSAEYMVRAHNLEELAELETKVMKCFEAGALASGAELEIEHFHPAYGELHLDDELTAVYRSNAIEIGRVFHDIPRPMIERAAGATDMGNVSMRMPSIQPAIGLDSFPAVPHMRDFTAAAATKEADQAVRDGALGLALTAMDVAADEGITARLMETEAARRADARE